jgi:hypothetical protein
MENEEDIEWVPLRYNDKYEISLVSHQIRVRKTGQLCTPSVIRNGYRNLTFNGKTVCEQVLLYHHFKSSLDAAEFIEHKKSQRLDIDHIDGNPSNNDPDNLQMITHADNLRKRRKYTHTPSIYVDKLPPDSVDISDFQDLDLDNYYYSDETGLIYKLVKTDKYKVINPPRNHNTVTLISKNPVIRNKTRSENVVVQYGKNKLETLASQHRVGDPIEVETEL